MFGRQPADNVAQSQASAAPAPPMAPQPQMTGVPAPQPLRNPDDLLRRAEWERLADADRAALLRPFQGRPVPQFGDVASEASTHADLRLQDWVAQLVAVSFQPQTAAYVRAWLSDGSPDGHLYVGGFSGQGRTSLVASVARQAMARAPIPVEYCYVPDLASLDKPMVLAVPDDTGADFTNALRTGLRLLLANWGGDGESDSSDNSDNSSDGSDSGASNDGSDASASSEIATGRRSGLRSGLRSSSGKKNRIRKNSVGRMNVATISYGGGKYFRIMNRNMKYHSGRASYG